MINVDSDSFCWMRMPHPESPVMAVYRGIFWTGKPEAREIEFSADMRCQLFLDGDPVADGPERGVPERWYFKRVKLHLTAGKHILCARVWHGGGKYWSFAQMSIRFGFAIRYLQADWSCQKEEIVFSDPFPDWAAFPRVQIQENYNPGILSGRGGVWQDVEFFTDSRVLFPPDLPEMTRVPVTAEEVKPGLWKFQEYVLAFPVCRFEGSGKVRIRWAECPYDDDQFEPVLLKGNKGRRNGAFFQGNWDEFAVNGALTWIHPLWKAGRYVQIETEGAVLVTAEYFRTGYPLPEYTAADPLLRIAFNTLRNCSWETFLDCPFYEQIMYVGDSRIEALELYRLGADRRLPAKALRIFACGQLPDGSIFSHYPCRGEQKILSFMLIWFLMLRDYVIRFPQDRLQEELLPCARRLLRYLQKNCTDGLLTCPADCWGFFDWCESWDNGVPPGSEPDSMTNLLYLLALRAAEEACRLPECGKQAEELAKILEKRYISPETGRIQMHPGREKYCEHSQVLGLLCGIGDPAKLAEGLDRADFEQCSIYFSFYYFEACRKWNLTELARRRLDKYRALLYENLTTLPEEFVKPRSDCHAWSAHVLLLEDWAELNIFQQGGNHD